MLLPDLPPRLGVNIDHIATVRNARGGRHPDPLRAAQVCVAAGADGITAHLREDRRHIRDADIERLISELTVPLNLEMAATDEMLALALRHLPHACCLVPERRAELTTEGGLDAARQIHSLQPVVAKLSEAGIRVSLFIDADRAQIDAALKLRAPVVEFHTGRWCHAADAALRESEFARLRMAIDHATKAGLECHAGHGLDFITAREISRVPMVSELNIGHFLVGEAIFISLTEAVRRMKATILEGFQALKSAA